MYISLDKGVLRGLIAVASMEADLHPYTYIHILSVCVQVNVYLT